MQYGPQPRDICLLIAVRHPGNLRYDPSVQNLEYREICLALLSAKVLENVILQRLLRGEEIPENGDRLEAWLTDVGMEHSFYLEIFDITNQLEQVKQQIRAADTANFSARMGRTIRRILILMIILTTVPLERLCFFIDEPNSAERLHNMRQCFRKNFEEDGLEEHCRDSPSQLVMTIAKKDIGTGL